MKTFARAVPVISMVVASASGAFGCQLLYDKNDHLHVGTGGGGSTATSMTGGAATTTETTTSSTTSAVGGTGGAATSAGGTGGTGGTTSTGGSGGTATTGGAGGTGGTTTSTTTPVCEEALFVFATSATQVLCATYTPATGWAPSTNANGNSSARPAAALLDAQTGIGLFYQGGATGPLRAVELAGGACGAPADVLAVTTKAAPSAAVLGGKVRALFQGAIAAGTDHPFVAAWDPATKWAAPAQIDGSVFSPAVAGLGTSGAEMLAVYGGGDGNLYEVRFAGAAWQLPAACFKDAGNNCEQANNALTPAVAGLDAGGWFVVFQEKANAAQLRWLTATAMGSAPSQVLAGASSSSPAALARVEGGAVLAFRGPDDKVYALTYESAAGSWGPITSVGGGATLASPAVAAGVCTHRAELVYIDKNDGSIRHASLEGGAWSSPAIVGGASMSGVAIAAAP